MRVRVPFLVLLVALACAGFHCTRDSREAPSPSPKPPADLRLWVVTDPRGYLEPCGCQLRPLGGVDKLATVLAEGRKDPTPSLTLVAGDLTFGSVLRPEDTDGARQQELWRAETLIDAWNSIGVDAVGPGTLDLSQAPGLVADLVKRSKFPWLVDNLEGSAPFGQARVVQVGEVKVGVMGLVTPTPEMRLPQGSALAPDLGSVAQKTAEALRAQGARLVIALLSGDRRTAREVAQKGVDVVVLGGLNHEEPLPPVVHEGSMILHAGYQGQRVVQVDLSLRGEGGFHDASAWTQRAARADIEKRAQELKAKIAAWEKDPGVNAQDLAGQRARLAELENVLKHTPQPDYSGRWFSAEVIDLAPEVPGDPALTQALANYDRRVNEHNRVALADRKPLPAPAGAPTYVGSESCKSCHEAAYDWWRNTKHGRAYATLEKGHKQFNLSCVGCHVTGYNQPGGSTVTHVENLQDVGCEACHGPSSLHNAEPEKPGLIARDTPESVCVSCHNHEHSARFVYDAFKSLLIVPGHGLPAPAKDAKIAPAP
jgi:hypothetical protein